MQPLRSGRSSAQINSGVTGSLVLSTSVPVEPVEANASALEPVNKGILQGILSDELKITHPRTHAVDYMSLDHPHARLASTTADRHMSPCDVTVLRRSISQSSYLSLMQVVCTTCSWVAGTHEHSRVSGQYLTAHPAECSREGADPGLLFGFHNGRCCTKPWRLISWS